MGWKAVGRSLETAEMGTHAGYKGRGQLASGTVM